MSTEEAISRKDKKAQRDAERRKLGKTKKRKHDETEFKEEAIQDRPDEDVEAALPKVKKSSKKRKVEALEPAGDDAPEIKEEDAVDSAASRPKKRKKKATTAPAGDATAVKVEPAADTDKPATKSKFILFIGNLPFKTTDDTLKAHFKSLQPFSLRHRTDPKTKKSKGFAFLEFENYDRMKTCLKLFHHSMFDPEAKEVGGTGKGNGKGGRKINVELTSGGGGNTEGRKEKIKVKNQRLEEQRTRRAELERKEKERKEKKEGKKTAASGGKDAKEGKAAPEPDLAAIAEAQGIHPSRLRRGVDF